MVKGEGVCVGKLRQPWGRNALILLIIAILVPILTAGHILRRIAHLGDIVVDLTQLATQITWILTIQADIELLAICGMRISGMGNHLAADIGLGLILGAGEAALGFLCRIRRRRKKSVD